LQFSHPLVGAFGSSAAGLAPINPGAWENVVLGAACPSGISIDSSSIGTTNTPSWVISTNNDNTFFANPDYGGTALLANRVRAAFRLANWGSSISAGGDWTTFGEGMNVATSAGGGIQHTCTQAAGPNQCPQQGTNMDHQCMLVELSGTGATPLNFARDSAWRNMEFATTSELRERARISIAGLPPTADGFRDVYIYVKTRNMPGPSTKPIQLPLREMTRTARLVNHNPNIVRGRDPKGESEDAEDGRAAEAPAALAAATAPSEAPALQNSYEQLAATWPTYEVHVYHDTGEVLGAGDASQRRLRPQAPFGYYLAHNGPLYGFVHSLHGANGIVLEELAPSFYRVSIADGQAIEVENRITSLEQPKGESKHTHKIVVKPGCYCRAAGAPSGGATGYRALFALAPLLLLAWRRRGR
jgi:hypothetical protein